MQRIINSTVTIIEKISKAMGVLVIAAMLFIMTVMVADILLRYLFDSPIVGVHEIVEYAAIISGFAGLAWCALKGGHLKVDLIVSRMPPRLQGVIDSIDIILGLTVVPIVIWQSFVQSRGTLSDHVSSNMLKIPVWPFYFVIGIGFTLLCLVMLIELVKTLAKVVKK